MGKRTALSLLLVQSILIELSWCTGMTPPKETMPSSVSMNSARQHPTGSGGRRQRGDVRVHSAEGVDGQRPRHVAAQPSRPGCRSLHCRLQSHENVSSALSEGHDCDRDALTFLFRLRLLFDRSGPELVER